MLVKTLSRAGRSPQRIATLLSASIIILVAACKPDAQNPRPSGEKLPKSSDSSESVAVKLAATTSAPESGTSAAKTTCQKGLAALYEMQESFIIKVRANPQLMKDFEAAINADTATTETGTRFIIEKSGDSGYVACPVGGIHLYRADLLGPPTCKENKLGGHQIDYRPYTRLFQTMSPSERERICHGGLAMLAANISQWALENKKIGNDKYSLDDKRLLAYLPASRLPYCPGGGKYVPGETVLDNPVCSVHGRR